MTGKMTVIEAGRLGNVDGELAASFVPEHNAVYLHASVPSDRRRSSITIRLTDTAPIRILVEKLEAAIAAEASRQASTRTGVRMAPVRVEESNVSVDISGSTITLPRDLYDSVVQLVNEGKSVLAAAALRQLLPWLGAAGGLEVAQAISDHQRALGLRE